MVYNFHLLFSNSLREDFDSSKSSGSLSIEEDEGIDCASFPVTLIYQNNQDRNVTLATDREFTVPSDNQRWIFTVENVISFAWETQSGKISYRFLAEATEDIFRFWLYHIVLPIYFSIGQVYKFLHTGAVEIEEKSVLFMAPSHGGKSTLTDYFLQRGHPLITDDKMATFEKEGEYYAVPSHPYHRPFRTVEVLGHLCENPATQIRPIHAIYILEKSEPEAQIVIRRLKGIEKFSRLHEGGEMNFSFFTPQYVTYLAGLANRVNVYEITVPHDMERLEEVYQTIKEHTREGR
ncbi:MAG: hypothetical protein Q7T91_07350 [Sulfuricurvum sp.]|nr:hypothetical protein [Sulfuricurvum sp.]